MCTGGNPKGLALDVKTVTVGGAITVNGQPPTAEYQSSQTGATVHLVDATQGYSFSLFAACAAAPGAACPLTFSGPVYPGTYRVTVGGTYLNEFPGASFLANPNLVVTASQPNLALDVKTVTVGGTVTVNGQPPTAEYQSSQTGASIHFADDTQGYSFSAFAACTAAPGAACPLTFTGPVYPGTYRVTVSGTYLNEFPGAAFIANPQLVVNANQPALALDVKTVTAGGTVTVNGQPPTAEYQSSQTGASIHFSDAAQGYSFSAFAACTAAPGASCPLTFTGPVYPGNYRVSISGTYLNEFPGAAFIANPQLAITTSQPALAFDVKTVTVGGGVTVNGQPPTAEYQSSQTGASNPLHRADARLCFAAFAACPAAPGAACPLTFTGPVYPGTYRITVSGTYLNEFPGAAFVANPQLAITASQPSLALDVKTVTVGGAVTVNGQPPTAEYQSSQTGASIHFADDVQGYDFSAFAACSAAPGAACPLTFTGPVYPGTYRYRERHLPERVPGRCVPRQRAARRHRQPARASRSDVKTLGVGGTCTVNGQPPTAEYQSSQTGASIHFTDKTSGYSFSAFAPCTAAPGAACPLTFTGPVYPGIYTVTVSGTYLDEMPGASYRAESISSQMRRA